MKYEGICIDGHLKGKYLRADYPEKLTAEHPRFDVLECIKNPDKERPDSKLVTYYYTEFMFGRKVQGIWYSNNSRILHGQEKHDYFRGCFIARLKQCIEK